MSHVSLGRTVLALTAALFLTACIVPETAGPVAPAPVDPAPVAPLPAGDAKAEKLAATFIAVVDRVEPVAKALCRRAPGPTNCNYVIAVDSRVELGPNAYFTLDERGRPYIVFTLSLLAMARNADELAFVMGHEAGHHIADHIPRRQSEMRSGAILAGVIAQAAGLSSEEVKQAQGVGAEVGARRYSREFELEADALGAEIALRAGFDPVLGAGFFDRLPDPGNKFLGTHPANSERQGVVRDTVRKLTAQ